MTPSASTFPTITADDWLTKCFRPFRAAGGVEANVAWHQIREKLMSNQQPLRIGDGLRALSDGLVWTVYKIGRDGVVTYMRVTPQGNAVGCVARRDVGLHFTKLSHPGAPAVGDVHTVARSTAGRE